MDVNQRKAVEIILNSESISRQQNEEIDSFIRWRMVNIMKVDFQDRLSKNRHCLEEAVFLYETFVISLHPTIKSAMHYNVQWKSKFLIQKYPLFALENQSK